MGGGAGTFRGPNSVGAPDVDEDVRASINGSLFHAAASPSAPSTLLTSPTTIAKIGAQPGLVF